MAPYYQDIWLNPETDDYTPEERMTFEYRPEESAKLIAAPGSTPRWNTTSPLQGSLWCYLRGP